MPRALVGVAEKLVLVGQLVLHGVLVVQLVLHGVQLLRAPFSYSQPHSATASPIQAEELGLVVGLQPPPHTLPTSSESDRCNKWCVT